jgi:acyl carrier protein
MYMMADTMLPAVGTELAQRRGHMSIKKDPLEQKILSVLRKVTARRTVNIDESFSDMGVDSIIALELIMRLEREFGITIPDNRMGELQSPRATVAIVREIREISAR